MAKVTGPLLSFDARGAIGKTLVFIGWKGLKTIRQFVIPANPRTAGQVAQRTKLSKLVKYWQKLSADDKGGWDKQAPIEPKVMSGFNSSTKHGIASLGAFVPGTAAADYTSTPGTGDIAVSTDILNLDDLTFEDSIADLKVRYGTDIRNMATQVAITSPGTGQPYAGTIAGLAADIPIFTQIIRGSSDLIMSGINVSTPS